MKALFTFTLGFIIARQLYINYDQAEAREKENQMKQKLKQMLRGIGLSKAEAEEASAEVTTG